MAELSYFMPGSGYFRRAIHQSNDVQELRELALLAVLEMEKVKDWIRDVQGVWPPHYVSLETELQAKEPIGGPVATGIHPVWCY